MLKNPENTVIGVERLLGRKYDDHVFRADWSFKIQNAIKTNIELLLKGEKKQLFAEEILSIFLCKLKENADI